MPKQRSESVNDKCAVCSKATGDNWLACEICGDWHHAKCLQLSEEAYKVLQNLDSCHWFCKRCNEKVGKIIPTLVGLQERIATTEKTVSKLENDMEKTNGQIIKIKSDVGKISNDLNAFKSEMDKHLTKTNFENRINKLELEFQKLSSDVKHISSTQEETHVKTVATVSSDLEKQIDAKLESVPWHVVVQTQVDESLQNMTKNIKEVESSLQQSRAEAAEQRDKEGRKNNIILYKVPETAAPRADERNKADISFCLQLFNNVLNVGIGEEDLIHVFRLGRMGENDTPRPLMVQFADYKYKNLVMENLFKLKHSEQKFNRVVIAHDMTAKEREECKKLVAEAKQRASEDTSGEYIYRVRGPPGQMKITRIRLRF